jgi:two-component SAPR family response regulator
MFRKLFHRLHFVIVILCTEHNNALAQSFGLGFHSHEKLKEERTELQLTPENPLHFDGEFSISFDLKLRPFVDQGFGYVVRIIQNDTLNVDIVYQIDYTTQEWHLYLIEGEKTSAGSYHLSQQHKPNDWLPFTLHFDLQRSVVEFYSSGEFITSISNELSVRDSYRIIFGASDYGSFKTRDVPAMSIRDIKLFSSEELYHHWPLNDEEGTTTFDIVGQKQAIVRNPNWLKPKHEYWTEVINLDLTGHVQVAADQEKEILYIVASDQLIIYSVSNNSYETIAYQHSPAELIGGRAFFNPIDEELYSYDVDHKTISKYSFSDKQWTRNKFSEKPHTVFLHHNSEFSTYDTSLYIFGGYGEHEYKNSIQQVNLNTNEWKILDVNKDIFNPRYLSASGYHNDSIYILGGYGSPSGSQMLNPQTYKHLLVYSVQQQQFIRETPLIFPQQDFSFSNSILIISSKREFYALAFPLFTDDSYLQLVHGSLNKPELRLMASPIPYHFQDTKSFADLFYFPASNRLITYSSYHEEDKTSVRLHSLLFPPSTVDDAVNNKQEAKTHDHSYALAIIIILAFVALLLLIWFIKKRSRSQNKPKVFDPRPMAINEVNKDQATGSVEKITSSSVLFFGGFQVYTQEGQDVTGKFTPLLKELFLLLWIHSLKDSKGISSERLTEILWSDKSSKSARNNKAVNIAKLRGLLTEIGNCEVSNKTGYWKIIWNKDGLYNDYSEFLNITESKVNLTQRNIHRLITIIEKGPFLLNVQYPWLDDIKASFSERLIDTLYYYAKKIDIQEDPKLVIKISDSIFSCDSISEEAMVLKCKAQHFLGSHSMAKNTYIQFCQSYRNLYDEEYNIPFSDIINLPLEEIVHY